MVMPGQQIDLSWLLNNNQGNQSVGDGLGAFRLPEISGANPLEGIASNNTLNRGDLSFSDNLLGTKDFQGRLGQALGAAGSIYNIYSGITGAADAKSQFNKKMDFMDRDYTMRKDAYDTAQTQRNQRVASARGGAAWDNGILGSV